MYMEVQMARPDNVGSVGLSPNLGLAVKDVNDSVRQVLTPNGLHFEPYDFEGLVLPSVTLKSPTGTEYVITFDNDGVLLVNGTKFMSDTKPLISPDGTKYKIVVDDTGILTTVKEVSDGSTNKNIQQL